MSLVTQIEEYFDEQRTFSIGQTINEGEEYIGMLVSMLNNYVTGVRHKMPTSTYQCDVGRTAKRPRVVSQQVRALIILSFNLEHRLKHPSYQYASCCRRNVTYI